MKKKMFKMLVDNNQLAFKSRKDKKIDSLKSINFVTVCCLYPKKKTVLCLFNLTIYMLFYIW